MSDKAVLFGWLAALTAAAGCIHEPAVYDVGDEARATQPQQPPVSTYPMPPTDPKGMVYVMSLGPERLPTAGGAQALFLHVRVAVENTSDDTPWQVDPNDEVAGFGNGTAVPPAFAEASTGGPVLNVPKGGRGHMDLFYPLPSQGEPPRVALSWRVHRGSEAVAQTTSFERSAPAQADNGYGGGYGGGGYGGGGYASSYDRPYGPDVRLSVGFDWWWPWGLWGGWGWGWPYRPYYAFPFYQRPYYGYRGGYAPAYRGGYAPGYRGGYGGRWVAPPVGGNWRGTAPSSSGTPLVIPRSNGGGGGNGAAGKSGWRGGGRR